MFAAEARQADAVCRDTAAVCRNASAIKGGSICVQNITDRLVGNLTSHSPTCVSDVLFDCEVRSA